MEKYLSLFEYLGSSAGNELGMKVYLKSQEQKVQIQYKDVKTKNWKGKINMYPKSFLDKYFEYETPEYLQFMIDSENYKKYYKPLYENY